MNVGKHQHRALLFLRAETLRKLGLSAETQPQHAAHRHEQHIMRQRESLLRPLFRAFRLFILHPDGGGRHAALCGSFSFLFHNLIYNIKSRACHSFDAPFRSRAEIKGKKCRLRQISTPFPLFRPRFRPRASAEVRLPSFSVPYRSRKKERRTGGKRIFRPLIFRSARSLRAISPQTQALSPAVRDSPSRHSPSPRHAAFPPRDAQPSPRRVPARRPAPYPGTA